MNRAHFVTAASAAAAATIAPAHAQAQSRRIIKPPRLRPGDSVGLIAPAGPLKSQDELQFGIKQIESIGLRAVVGKHAMDRNFYLAGSDAARAEDVNTFASDPQIRGIFALRGGYGTMRILDLIDYAAIAADPKPMLGFSDLTALLNVITMRTGLVTFHAPVAAASTYTPIVVSEIQAAVMSAQPIGTLQNATTVTVTPGVARGKLVGGNLTLVSALAGTPYAVPCANNILLLEDVHEEPYQVDQLMTTLALTGALHSAAGIAAGTFMEPDRKQADEPSPELAWTLHDRLTLSGRPAVYGMQFGHISNQWVLPLGLNATLDASAGTLTIDEAAVS
jgi:muramoyltetrapeptide carboxypeptidase